MPPSGAGTGPRRAGLQPWGRRFAVRYRVEVDVRHRPVETLRLVREAERQCDGDVGGDHTEVPRGDRDARLAAAIDIVEARWLGRRRHRAAEAAIAQVA